MRSASWSLVVGVAAAARCLPRCQPTWPQCSSPMRLPGWHCMLIRRSRAASAAAAAAAAAGVTCGGSAAGALVGEPPSSGGSWAQGQEKKGRGR